MEKKRVGMFEKIKKALIYSIQGLRSAFKHEQAFRLELYGYIPIAAVSMCFVESTFEVVMLVFITLLTFIAELLNSGIEAVVDRISFKHHELSGRAKDFGSAAVFLSHMNALIIWLIIFVPKIYSCIWAAPIK